MEAGPPSATYRLRKFARKHRALLPTAAAFAALLVLATVVSTWQAIRATRAEAKALQAEAEANEGLRRAVAAERESADAAASGRVGGGDRPGGQRVPPGRPAGRGRAREERARQAE